MAGEHLRKALGYTLLLPAIYLRTIEGSQANWQVIDT